MILRKLDQRYTAAAEILSSVTDKERYALISRLLKKNTLKEVGDRMGVSPQMVRLFEQQALIKITKAFDAHAVKPPRRKI